ncbi:hypothetical protein CRG98_045220 [Punica granatum]|uniref:Uncharacterized protein n=1 Tax=Punica granatum TaxID=22663 RepID=A0A2I0HRN9_PUNGR|nr:hypothetical protein CRG98_045220 [Punica granatum]
MGVNSAKVLAYNEEITNTTPSILCLLHPKPSPSSSSSPCSSKQQHGKKEREKATTTQQWRIGKNSNGISGARGKERPCNNSSGARKGAAMTQRGAQRSSAAATKC